MGVDSKKRGCVILNISTPTSQSSDSILSFVLQDLHDLKAVNVHQIDVANLTTVTDHMVIATGNSSRHVRAIADNLLKSMKKRGIKPLIENDEDNEWVLVDLGDIVIHIMQPKAREFYCLEKLWSATADNEAINV